jgi:hypothetical protein
MARARNAASEYVRLEERLVLLAWLNEHFGYENSLAAFSMKCSMSS